jgi:hypothetical protein
VGSRIADCDTEGSSVVLATLVGRSGEIGVMERFGGL